MANKSFVDTVVKKYGLAAPAGAAQPASSISADPAQTGKGRSSAFAGLKNPTNPYDIARKYNLQHPEQYTFAGAQRSLDAYNAWADRVRNQRTVGPSTRAQSQAESTAPAENGISGAARNSRGFSHLTGNFAPARKDLHTGVDAHRENEKRSYEELSIAYRAALAQQEAAKRAAEAYQDEQDAYRESVQAREQMSAADTWAGNAAALDELDDDLITESLRGDEQYRAQIQENEELADALGLSGEERRAYLQSSEQEAWKAYEHRAANSVQPGSQQRISSAVKGVLEGFTANNADFARAIYESGQESRNAQTAELLEQAERELELARRNYEIYAEDYGPDSREARAEEAHMERLEDLVNAYRQAPELQQQTTDAAAEMSAALSAQAAEDLEASQEGLGRLGKFGMDLFTTALEMGADALVGNALVGNGLVSMFNRVLGGKATEVRSAGGDISAQLAAGSFSAGVEVFSEMLFDGLAGLYGGGELDEIVDAVIRRCSKSDLGRKVLLTFASAAEEGLEEAIPPIFNAFARLVAQVAGREDGWTQYLDSDSLGDTLYGMLLGAALGGLGGGINLINGETQERVAAMRASDGTGTASNAELNNSEARIDQAEDETENESSPLAYREKQRGAEKGEADKVSLPGGGTGAVTKAAYSAETGKTTLTVTDGQGNEHSLDRSELSGEAGQLFDLLEDMLGKQYAPQAFNMMNEDQQAAEYAVDFRNIRELGQKTTRETVDYSRYQGTLTDEQAAYAFTMGKGMARRELSTREKSRRGTGKVSLDGGMLDGRSLAPVADREALQKSEDYKAVEAIAKALDVDVVFYESQTDESGNYQGANGAYHGGVIWLDAHAGMESAKAGERMFFTTMSHELTHFIRQNAAEMYEQLQERVTDYLRESEDAELGELIREKLARSSQRLSYEDALEEVVADSCETMLRDSRAVEELARKKPGLFSTVRDYIKDFIDRILPRHREAKAIQPIIRDVQEIWDKALIQAVESRVSVETLENLPTAAEIAEAVLAQEKSRRSQNEKLDRLLQQTLAVQRSGLSNRPVLPAHGETAAREDSSAEPQNDRKTIQRGKADSRKLTPEEKRQREQNRRRFNKAVDELIETYMLDGEDLSREDAEKLCLDYAAAHEGYYSLGDEYRQRKVTGSRKKMREAYYESMENAAQESGGVKYAERERMSQSEIHSIQSIGRKSLNHFTAADIRVMERLARRYYAEMGEKSPFFRAWFGDWRVNDQTPVSVANQRGDARGLQHNEDTGWNINISRKVFDETNAQKAKNITAARPYLLYIDDIVRKAVLLDSFGIGNAKSENSLLMHSLYAVADIGNGPELIKLLVEEMNDPNADGTSKRAYQLRNLESQQLKQSGSPNSPTGLATSSTAGIKNVSDLFAYVKEKDSSFQPKSASKVVNDDGTPRIVYHGTDADFSVFDRAKGRSSMDIQGMFFSPVESEAGDYGSRVGAYYLNLQNPASESAAYHAFAQFKGQNDAGIRAREYLEALGYDGVVNDDEYIAFDPAQIKSATENIGTFDAQNPDIRFQERDDARTDRELLLESDGTELTAAERAAVAAYRERVETLRAREQRVQEALSELDKLVRDGASREAINKQRTKVSNLQAGMQKALRELTADETKDKTLLEIIRKEREIQRRRVSMRTRDVFTRRELRGRITKLYNELSRKATKAGPKDNIPAAVMQQAMEVLQAINMDSSKEGSVAGESLRERLLELQDKYRQLQDDTDFQKAALWDPVVSELLKSMVDAVGDTPINKLSTRQLRAVYDTLRALDKTAREERIRLSKGEERTAYQIAMQMKRETESVSKPHKSLADRYINTQLSPERMFNRLGGYQKDSAWLEVYRMLNEGQLKATDILVKGSRIFDELMEGKGYESFVNPKQTVDIGLKDENGAAIPITHGMMVALYMHLQNEQNRRHVAFGGLTVPDLRDYYKGRNNRGIDNAVRAEGVSREVAELRDRYWEAENDAERDELAKQIKKAQKRSKDEAEDYLRRLEKNIEKNLTDYDRQWIAAARDLFDRFSKEKLNETTMEVYGIKRATVDNYFPIWVDGDFLQVPFESIAKDMSLENVGFLKERVDSAKPMRLADVSDVSASQLRRVAQYSGLMPVTRRFQKIWGKVETGYRGSLQAAVRERFGQGGIQYIDNLMADLNGARGARNGQLDEFFSRVRGNMAQASLTLSARVALGQTASYPTAASVVGWGPLRKALLRGGKNNWLLSRADQELIAKWSPLLAYRMKGYSTTELGDLTGSNSKKDRVWKKMRWLTGWIQAMDGATVGRLWYAAQYYVEEKQPALRKGTDAYYEAAAKVFNDIVEKTQPDYTTMQRPDILRNPSSLVRQLTMFLTQRLQNFNILYDAAATYSRRREDLKRGTGGVTAQDVKDAGRDVRRAVSSQLAAAATITAFKFLADGVLHSMNAYRDDDKELTQESILLELLDMFADSLAGNVLFGGELYDLIESRVFGKTYYGIEVSGVATVTDVIESMNKVIDTALKEDSSWRDVWSKGGHQLARNISTLFGMPLSNGEKIVMGVWNHARDIKNGEFLSMEAGVERSVAQQAGRLYRAYTEANFGQARKIREQVGDDDKLNQALAAAIKKQFAAGEISQDKAAQYLVRFAGKDQAVAEKTMLEYACEVETGIKFSQIADAFTDGEITEAKATQLWQKYGDKSAAEAQAKAEFTLFKDEHPDTQLVLKSYQTYKAKYEKLMSATQYEQYAESMNACTGWDADGDGKTDSGSKKKQQMDVINALPLSSAQKDELYRLNGWAESTLKDAPWHS